ncbi:SUMO-activating enzyme subunit 2-A [Bulinus truncatus]|nr:SUMO-activating enzyme subunit 2-A [Bulinus truncatus]
MAATLNGVLENQLVENLKKCKLLMVGAKAALVCELLKNLVLTGFTYIEVIDLDTIDVSNLNRQFLFRKEHVGKSKAQVAKESALKFNPNANITAHHDSIFSQEFGLDFFKQFTLVLNALDNRAARNHVNRMCLAADIPLIESGTAGYLGQVTVIKKFSRIETTVAMNVTQNQPRKHFLGVLLRNTPSEPVHCGYKPNICSNQLFGEDDPDQDVSPDTEDPELAANAGQAALSTEAKKDAVGGIERKSTRAWAMDNDYDAEKLFNKLFRDDIKYLLSMETLWKKRRPPQPLDFNDLPGKDEVISTGVMRDQRVWSVQECADVFSNCLNALKQELNCKGDGGTLAWDKDDHNAMDFVASVTNIRAHIFGIPLKSKFDIKSIAGNIIPAIATTNAVIAGLIVMEALKILSGKISKCKQVYLNRIPNDRKRLLLPCALDPPNPKCYVCSEKHECTVVLNTDKVTVRVLQDKILKRIPSTLVAPDVEIDDGKGTIIISSEEGETEENYDKVPCEKHDEEKEFEVVGDISQFHPKDAEMESQNPVQGQTNGNGASVSKEDDEDDIRLIEENEEQESTDKTFPSSRKRPAEGDNDGESLIKRKKHELDAGGSEDVIEIS